MQLPELDELDYRPVFRDHHGTAGVGPSQERLPVCFGSSLPPCSTPRAVGRRNWDRSQLGTQQAWPNLTLRGCTLNQDCGPRGELRGGLPSAEG